MNSTFPDPHAELIGLAERERTSGADAGRKPIQGTSKFQGLCEVLEIF